ncbi:MAG: radical SAM protein [Thermacetogeniaceae bacterium]
MSKLSEILEQAWQVRAAHQPKIVFAAPGAKHYQNRFYANHARSFVNLSVTGTACACNCAHCRGKLLETMIPASTPEALRRQVERLAAQGCRGILVSGGADAAGEVPLLPFAGTLKRARELGLRVLVHSGLISRSTAGALKEAGVDQVLLDVIGDEDTIREVYHLDRKPHHYLEAMLNCREAGLNIAPHLVIGLHYGTIRGELNALEMIRQASPQALVLVILSPLSGTGMNGTAPPPVEEVACVIGTGRLLNPDAPLTLGCARPPGAYKRAIEKLAVDCGVDAIAYPDESTVLYARRRGLAACFTEECCSLAGLAAAAPEVCTAH